MPPPAQQQETITFDTAHMSQHDDNHAVTAPWWTYDDPRSLTDDSSAESPPLTGGFISDSMRTDGFDGKSAAEQRRVTSTATATANTLALPPHASDLHCPQCGLLTENGFTFHRHITSCFLTAITPAQTTTTAASSSSSSSSSRSSKSHHSASSSSSPSALSIASLQSCLSSLDLHERISLMEALFRLSRSTAAVENDHSQNVHLDERVISLLYSAPQPTTPSTTSSRSFPDNDSVASPLTPPLSPYSNSHTCLTPTIHNVSFNDGAHAESYYVDDMFSSHLDDQTDGAVPFKRQRALSQPYIKPMHQSNNMTNTTQLTRQYSPVHVHHAQHVAHHQPPYIQPLELPKPPRRKSTSGATHSKRLFVSQYHNANAGPQSGHHHSSRYRKDNHPHSKHLPTSQSFSSIITQSAPSSSSNSPVSSPNSSTSTSTTTTSTNTTSQSHNHKKRTSSALRT